ncbi:hypothetical protein ACFYST_08245 [Kitasatospora sp. NPDC004614]|uniref:hypothetical protein n=1 Tax=unclassified Kitasatospora TaxID=2633591 RepID=UPI00367D241A
MLRGNDGVHVASGVAGPRQRAHGGGGVALVGGHLLVEDLLRELVEGGLHVVAAFDGVGVEVIVMPWGPLPVGRLRVDAAENLDDLADLDLLAFFGQVRGAADGTD